MSNEKAFCHYCQKWKQPNQFVKPVFAGNQGNACFSCKKDKDEKLAAQLNEQAEQTRVSKSLVQQEIDRKKREARRAIEDRIDDALLEQDLNYLECADI